MWDEPCPITAAIENFLEYLERIGRRPGIYGRIKTELLDYGRTLNATVNGRMVSVVRSFRPERDASTGVQIITMPALKKFIRQAMRSAPEAL